MRSIRFKLAVLVGGAALLALVAAGGLWLALGVMDATLDRALAAQQRLDGLTEVSARLTDYGLAAIDAANAPDARGERLQGARQRVEAAIGLVDAALARHVEEAQGALGRNELAARSRPLAQLRAGFDLLDQQIAAALEAPQPGQRADAIRGAFNAFAASTGPVLSFLVEAERRGVEAARDDERRLSGRLAAAAMAAGLVAIAVAVVLHRSVARPIVARIDAIRAAAGAIGRGELGLRLAIGARDELGLLAAIFNRMAARLRRREQRVAAGRLALEQTITERTADLTAANARLGAIDQSRRRFFADVSHELRTPLTVILGECDVALRPPPALEAYGSALAVIRKRAQLLHRRVEDLLRVARSESGEIGLDFKRADLGTILAAAINSFDALARRRGVAIALAVPDHDIEVVADREWLRQIVEGLIDNALRHAAGATRIAVSLDDCGDHAQVGVADNGCGFPAGDSEALFGRFVRRGRIDAPGYGIGLALARWVVEQHGGSIRLSSAVPPLMGASVVVSLPKAARGEAARGEAARGEATRGEAARGETSA